MISPIISSSGIAYPDDLALLKRVYDSVCLEKNIRQGSAEGADMAAQAMHLFSRGVFVEEILVRELRTWSERYLSD